MHDFDIEKQAYLIFYNFQCDVQKAHSNTFVNAQNQNINN